MNINRVTIAFLLTIIAGSSTMIGCIFIFFKCKNHQKIINYSLGFASGVMFGVCITDLIPECLKLLGKNYNFFETNFLCLLFISLGIIISMVIDYYLPDKSDIKINNKELYKTGLLAMIAIILHNIPEGIATFISANNELSLGITMTIAIAMHNIPEGITIAVPIYYSTNSKLKAIFYTFISAISEPFGALITYLFLFNYVNDIVLGLLFALISGIMFQIVFCELLPKIYKDKKSYFFIIFGLIFIFIKFL